MTTAAAASMAKRRSRLLALVEDALVGSAPVPDDAIPEWALGPRELSARARRLRAHPDRFLGWRLGWLATHMRGRGRERTVDQAIRAFARIVDTPTGPGNDDGPFCDVAPIMSARQVAAALRVVDRMRAAGGWGDEVGSAGAALVARLHELGRADAAARELGRLHECDQAFVARLVVGSPRRPRTSGLLERATVDDVRGWPIRACEARLHRFIRARRGRSDLGEELLRAPVVAAVESVGGRRAVAALRRLVGRRTTSRPP